MQSIISQRKIFKNLKTRNCFSRKSCQILVILKIFRAAHAKFIKKNNIVLTSSIKKIRAAFPKISKLSVEKSNFSQNAVGSCPTRSKVSFLVSSAGSQPGLRVERATRVRIREAPRFGSVCLTPDEPRADGQPTTSRKGSFSPVGCVGHTKAK